MFFFPEIQIHIIYKKTMDHNGDRFFFNTMTAIVVEVNDHEHQATAGIAETLYYGCAQAAAYW